MKTYKRVIAVLISVMCFTSTVFYNSNQRQICEAYADEKLEMQTQQEAAIAAITDMRVNGIQEAYGIPIEQCRFSWKLQTEEEQAEMVAYRIHLYGKENDDERFDTGWVDGNRNYDVRIPYQFEKNTLYYWSVEVRMTSGAVYHSKKRCFSTEIEFQNNAGIWAEHGNYALFRWEDQIDTEEIDKAILSVSGLSGDTTKQYTYTLFVNQENVGVGPAVPDMEKRIVRYDSYDVTDNLKNGTNVISAICYALNNQSFLAELNLFYKDGHHKKTAVTGELDENWKCLPADDIYGNGKENVGTGYYFQARENLDGSIYPYGWMEAGYIGAFQNPIINQEFNSFELQPYTSGRQRYEYIEPENVTRLSNGEIQIDFGKELIGMIELSTKEETNKSLTVMYGEQLDENQNVKYAMNTGNVYLENWTVEKGEHKLSGLNMKAFRYVQLRGVSGDFSSENIRGIAVKKERNEEHSELISSNEILQKIYDIGKYTANMSSQSMYVDSQTRERENYMGDTYINMLSDFVVNEEYSLGSYSVEYALNHPTWPAEYRLLSVNAAYDYYLYSGDIDFLKRNYQTLENCFEEFLTDQTGLVYSSDRQLLVDWPMTERDNYAMDATYNTVLNAVYAGASEAMSLIAGELGNQNSKNRFQQQYDTVKQSMIQYLYDDAKGKFCDGLDDNGKEISHYSMHANVYALAAGIYDSVQMSDTLANSIEAEGMNRTSVYTTFFLLKGLYRSGNDLLARKIMTNPSIYTGAHTWANMYRNSSMSSEAWDASLKSNLTYSHPWGNGAQVWLVKGLFGINPIESGYHTFEIKVQPGGVKSGMVRVPVNAGMIQVSYELQRNTSIKLNVTVPENTKAYVKIKGTSESVYVNGELKSTVLEDGYQIVALSAGTYEIQGGSGYLLNQDEMAEYNNVIYNSYLYQGGLQTNGNSSNEIGKDYIRKFRAFLNTNTTGSIRYRGYTSGKGYTDWYMDGTVLMDGRKKYSALMFELTGNASRIYDVYYRVYVDGYGWLGYAKNGEMAGSQNVSLSGIRAIEMLLVKRGQAFLKENKNAFQEDSGVTYQTHVQSYGWMDKTSEGEISGTVGERKRVEAIRISVHPNLYSYTGGIRYQTYVQSYGFLPWKQNGEISGTTGQSKRVEGIKIELTGEIAKAYDIYYCVQSESYGWLDWAKNGEYAGTAGYAKRMEALRIMILPKTETIEGKTEAIHKVNLGVGYQTHVQSHGWMDEKVNGEMSGTTGQSKRMEAVKINLKNNIYGGDILYRTHVQNNGWMNYVKNGALSGTSGQSKRAEAIQIRLSGEVSKYYDVYYRVHCQSYGWLGWAKNGEEAGTSGLGKRVETIQVVLVKKGAKAPGSTARRYVKK